NDSVVADRARRVRWDRRRHAVRPPSAWSRLELRTDRRVVTRRRVTRIKILVAAAIGACVLLASPVAWASTWGAETSPITSTLFGVSCPDTTDCWGVGGTSS